MVLGYDATLPAEHALAHAGALARALGAHVVVADIAAPDLRRPMPGAFGLMAYT
jgi:hypothetical protein